MDKMVRALWPKEARPIAIKLEDIGGLIAVPKVFKTGSVGWYANGKITISDTPVQVNICVTVIGSKEDQCSQAIPDEQKVTIDETPVDVPTAVSQARLGFGAKANGRKHS